MDRIIVSEQQVTMRIGCGEEERSKPQRIVITCTVDVASNVAVRTLKVEDTVCYFTLAQLIKEMAISRAWILLEEFGEALSAQIFSTFSKAQQVHLLVKKFILPDAAYSAVEMTRIR